MKKQFKKRAGAYTLVALLLVIGFFVFRFFTLDFNFNYYAPSYLPPNISTHQKRIRVRDGITSVEHNFRAGDDWLYAIRERKATNADQNFSSLSGSDGVMCSVMVTPAKTQYRLCRWVDYGSVNVLEIRFVITGTYVEAQIPTTLEQSLSPQEVEKFVDSFKRKSTLAIIGLPVYRDDDHYIE